MIKNIDIHDINKSNDGRTFIIAEISANHGHDLRIVKDTIKAAKEIGADAVKIQTYTPDTITIDCDNEYFQIKQDTIWDGTTLYKLYEGAYTPWEWHEAIFNYAKEIGIICFSTPFDFTAVDFLEKFEVPAYKIASFEITDIPLIEYTAAKGKPMIISTGIATLEEIEEAVKACRKMGNEQIILLKCTSSYPAPLEEMNLKTIPDIKERFKVVVGLSDHSLGTEAAVAAVTLGAKVVEKHFILDKSIGGPDAEFSLDIKDFENLIKGIRNVEKALGKVSYELTDKTLKNRGFSRSLFITEDVKAGEKITEKNIRSIRPGYGMAPKYYNDVLGREFKNACKRGTPLSWDLIK